MSKPRILDLFCCAGGAGKGYHDAGFDVKGIDISPQPRYPYEFKQADAINYLELIIYTGEHVWYDAFHASPPCQGYTALRHAPGTKGAPKLIPQVRELLDHIGKPYVIENVEEARSEMRDPMMLCGSAFGLQSHGCELRRHRLFESNVALTSPGCQHGSLPVVGVYGGHARIRSAKHGGRTTRDTWPNGHKPVAAEAMGMDWATLAEMSEAIPPAYTRHIGLQLIDHIRNAA